MHNAILPPDPMEELEKNKALVEHQQLTKKERRFLKRQQRKKEQVRLKRHNKIKKILRWFLILVLVTGGVLVIGFWLSSQKIDILPPINVYGHSEQFPSSNILVSPIPISVQKHILEHTPESKPGVVINYNCNDFKCEVDLIPKLEKIVQDYDFVYLAPFPNMTAKIVLTKINKRKVLEEFNEEKIRDFIKK